MQKENRLVLACAGSGKTTFLVRRALEESSGSIIITTFTEANKNEIKQKFVQLNGGVPGHVTIMTWFTFLLKHGVKPFQGSFNHELLNIRIKGMIFCQQASGQYKNLNGEVRYVGEQQFKRYYFTQDYKIYSDKLSKFVCQADGVVGGEVVSRICRIYTHIFIDEVQDLAGYDLEFIKLLFKNTSNILLVGDPRQVTYLTHHERKHSGYKGGLIKQFLLKEIKKVRYIIDETTLIASHRNNKPICDFSSKLYPEFKASIPCDCTECRGTTYQHTGIFLVKPEDVKTYVQQYSPVLLRDNSSIHPDWNFGKSKGLSFDRVLIYPTQPMTKYLRDGKLTKIVSGVEKPAFEISNFYVAITRARISVGIVCKFEKEESFIDGVQFFDPSGL
ncbi:UvrD-helicase domain-containing protein [Dyadobacter sp. CY351]|uniref:UvrD-helicase domain-containing protein n=1 Tax=Dyadobacter sp. CY351 TaxID=2909337 RepID=UPI001F1FE438|nr:UvrD-helicase domain-containing protein [Dyadobacter sp. CY351]MCF2519137.1 UvrD-helicase domain-containing protein [Dyadobacter sp. CY351]